MQDRYKLDIVRGSMTNLSPRLSLKRSETLKRIVVHRTAVSETTNDADRLDSLGCPFEILITSRSLI